KPAIFAECQVGGIGTRTCARADSLHVQDGEHTIARQRKARDYTGRGIGGKRKFVIFRNYDPASCPLMGCRRSGHQPQPTLLTNVIRGKRARAVSTAVSL